MRKTAWFFFIVILGLIYVASSIPGLRVLPVLRLVFLATEAFSGFFSQIAVWLASQIPLDFSELGYIDAVSRDFLMYTRENPIVIEFFMRKLAHVFVFFLLTLALFFLLYQYVPSAGLCLFLSYAGGFVLAVLDEYRQSFVPGRVASAVDVLIDMIGVTLAVCMIMFSLVITSGQGGTPRFFGKRRGGPHKKKPPVRKASHIAGTYVKVGSTCEDASKADTGRGNA